MFNLLGPNMHLRDYDACSERQQSQDQEPQDVHGELETPPDIPPEAAESCFKFAGAYCVLCCPSLED